MGLHKALSQNLLWRGLYFVVAFGMNIVLARRLGPAGTGEVLYASNIFAFLLLVCSLNLETAISYFGATNKVSTNKLFGLYTTVAVLAGLLAAFIVYVLVYVPHLY